MLQEREREREEKKDCRAFARFLPTSPRTEYPSMLESMERNQRQGSPGIRTSESGSASGMYHRLASSISSGVGTAVMVGPRWCRDGVGMFGTVGWFGRSGWAGWLRGQVGRLIWLGRLEWSGWVGRFFKVHAGVTTHAVTTNILTLLFGTPCQVSRSSLVHFLLLIEPWLMFMFVLTYFARSRKLLVSASVRHMMSSQF